MTFFFAMDILLVLPDASDPQVKLMDSCMEIFPRAFSGFYKNKVR
jgi:hypothetical protein